MKKILFLALVAMLSCRVPMLSAKAVMTVNVLLNK